jgi:hypothetical protein
LEPVPVIGLSFTTRSSTQQEVIPAFYVQTWPQTPPNAHAIQSIYSSIPLTTFVLMPPLTQMAQVLRQTSPVKLVSSGVKAIFHTNVFPATLPFQGITLLRGIAIFHVLPQTTLLCVAFATLLLDISSSRLPANASSVLLSLGPLQ